MEEIRLLLRFSLFSIVIFLIAAKACKDSPAYQRACALIFATLTFIAITFFSNSIPFKSSDKCFCHPLFLKSKAERDKERELLKSFTFINIVKESEDTADITQARDFRDLFDYLSKRLSSSAGGDAIDLVVVNAVFSQRLSTEMEPLCRNLMKTKKVIFAFENYAEAGFYSKQQVYDNYIGSSTYATTEDEFLNYSLLDKGEHEPSVPSLPYLAWLRLTGHTSRKLNTPFAWLNNTVLIESQEGGVSCFVLNDLIPEVYPETSDYLNPDGALFDLNRGLVSADASHLRAFESRLRLNKQLGYQNILVVGSFKNETVGVPVASYGQMQGSIVLTGILTNLLMEHHLHTLAFSITLFLGLVLIYYFLISKACMDKSSWERVRRKEKPVKKLFSRFVVTRFAYQLFRYIIIDLSDYWIWVILFLLVYFTSHHLINVASLLFVSLLLEKTFEATLRNREE